MNRKKRNVVTYTAALAAILACPAHADLGDQLFKLLADDGEAGDQFGNSVAFSGTTGIVGAWADTDNGSSSGSAYLFDITTGQQLFKLLPNDAAAGDRFGRWVAISGDTAIVGALNDDDNGTDSGSAYLFDAATGQQIAKLLAEDGAAGDHIGASVAISGATAIVGAWGVDDDSGAAYLFDISDPKTPVQIAKLLPDDGAVGDLFGISVAISDDTAIVGAYFHDDNGSNSGSAYLFDINDPNNPVQIAKLLPDDAAGGDFFGLSVAISGDTAIVGALNDDDNGEDSGSAYLFDTATGQQIAKLLPDDGAAGDWFGRSVGISGATAIVGAEADADNGFASGSAYLFDIDDPNNPVQIAKLLPDDGAAVDIFGTSVAISGETAIVGALGDDDNGSLSGSAYLFDANTCPADLDGDGDTDADDFFAYLDAFASDELAVCDIDGDGDCDADDFFGYLDLFAAGC